MDCVDFLPFAGDGSVASAEEVFLVILIFDGEERVSNVAWGRSVERLRHSPNVMHSWVKRRKTQIIRVKRGGQTIKS